MTKFKFVDFPGSGIQCAICGKDAHYLACNSHETTYPVLTTKNLIRVPNCKSCRIECPNCGEVTLPQYLETALKKERVPKKLPRPKPKDKEPQIKTTFSDRLKLVDLSEIRDIEISRNSTKGILNLIFGLETGTQLGMDDIENLLEPLGMDIDFGGMRAVNDRIAKLLYTLLKIRASGLSSYEKVIMEAEIEKLYGDRKETLADMLKNYMENRQPKR